MEKDVLQQAFERFRAKLVHSMQLILTNKQKNWIINSDASGRAVGYIKGMMENSLLCPLRHVS